jgi:hypothetical protein
MSNKQPEDLTNVLPFSTQLLREPPLTAAELAEYRRLRPMLRKLVEDWPKIVSGCPIAKRTVG